MVSQGLFPTLRRVSRGKYVDLPCTDPASHVYVDPTSRCDGAVVLEDRARAHEATTAWEVSLSHGGRAVCSSEGSRGLVLQQGCLAACPLMDKFCFRVEVFPLEVACLVFSTPVSCLLVGVRRGLLAPWRMGTRDAAA